MATARNTSWGSGTWIKISIQEIPIIKAGSDLIQLMIALRESRRLRELY